MPSFEFIGSVTREDAKASKLKYPNALALNIDHFFCQHVDIDVLASPCVILWYRNVAILFSWRFLLFKGAVSAVLWGLSNAQTYYATLYSLVIILKSPATYLSNCFLIQYSVQIVVVSLNLKLFSTFQHAVFHADGSIAVPAKGYAPC